MKKYTVNIPVWHIYFVEAENEQDALNKADQQFHPDTTQHIEDMEVEVNEDVKD